MKDADGFAIPSLPTKSAKPKTADQVKNEEIGQLIGPSIPSSAGAQESEGTSPPPLQGTDRTIFLSNIPFDWTADNIRRLFPNAVDFRIPHKTKGQNKVIHYIYSILESSPFGLLSPFPNQLIALLTSPIN